MLQPIDRTARPMPPSLEGTYARAFHTLNFLAVTLLQAYQALNHTVRALTVRLRAVQADAHSNQATCFEHQVDPNNELDREERRAWMTSLAFANSKAA